ncbi:MAG: formylglycine-generating enzyme family protein, partial [bacterium]
DIEIFCGSCETGEYCKSSDHTCSDQIDAPECNDFECGTAEVSTPDGLVNVVCGECGAEKYCDESGECFDTVQEACGGGERECGNAVLIEFGDDLFEVSCGECDPGNYCVSNYCNQIPPPDGQEIMKEIYTSYFEMGCSGKYDPKCNENEKPEHTVNFVNSFRIMAYEVTNSDYAYFLNQISLDNKCEDYDCMNPDMNHLYLDVDTWKVEAGFENMPVEAVSWYGAKQFCTETFTPGTRLPSEAEWEAAARHEHEKRIYPWGVSEPDCSKANFSACTGETVSVDSNKKGVSHYGIFNMAGNVAEWVEDDWHDNYIGAPGDRSPWVEDPRDSKRVIRGGSYLDNSENIRAAKRFGEYPDKTEKGYGFRCVEGAPE